MKCRKTGANYIKNYTAIFFLIACIKIRYSRNGLNELRTRFKDSLASLIKYEVSEGFISVRNPAERFRI